MRSPSLPSRQKLPGSSGQANNKFQAGTPAFGTPLDRGHQRGISEGFSGGAGG